jgi:hypothetical protein
MAIVTSPQWVATAAHVAGANTDVTNPTNAEGANDGTLAVWTDIPAGGVGDVMRGTLAPIIALGPVVSLTLGVFCKHAGTGPVTTLGAINNTYGINFNFTSVGTGLVELELTESTLTGNVRAALAAGLTLDFIPTNTNESATVTVSIDAARLRAEYVLGTGKAMAAGIIDAGLCLGLTE